MLLSLFLHFIYQSKTSPFMSIFTAVSLSTCAVNGQYLCMYLHPFIGLPFHLWADCALFLVPNCAAVSYFENSRVSFASKFHPFQFPCVYGSSSVHLIERASVGILLLFQKHFFHSSHKPPFKSTDNVFLSMVVVLFSGECRDSLSAPAPGPPSLVCGVHLGGPSLLQT